MPTGGMPETISTQWNSLTRLFFKMAARKHKCRSFDPISSPWPVEQCHLWLATVSIGRFYLNDDTSQNYSELWQYVSIIRGAKKKGLPCNVNKIMNEFFLF
jgi:hypothetical protein